MFQKIKDNIAVNLVTSFLGAYETNEIQPAKRFLSIVASIYIIQSGIKDLSKHPIYSAQKLLLAGALIYSAAIDLNKRIIKKPKETDIRRNQIQGNDPNSQVPAFV
ncbi:hypothetical protein [Pedobacter psychroterrae]|uniref:Uncharacterized protein n=1 Tax=Pedobacter psychroterrae TaxID=2530453 RepID=A0A4R0NIS9_9SPHI|nr:hypothetical protein [Pedobacter psychroterrae]TCD00129.1 hypothetical protein EZ437_15540 [Pedobacter psychroterrae]